MTKDATSYNFKTVSCYGDATIEGTSGGMQLATLQDVEALLPQEELQHCENNVAPNPISKEAKIRFALTGVVAGLIARAVTFGSFAFLCRNPQPESRMGLFFYVMIMVLRQIESVLYIAISIGLAFSFIKLGTTCFGEMNGQGKASTMNRQRKERFAFVLSVSFFACGAVVGSLLVWLVVGILWGLPLAVLPQLTVASFTC
jgi:hypothetical protein